MFNVYRVVYTHSITYMFLSYYILNSTSDSSSIYTIYLHIHSTNNMYLYNVVLRELNEKFYVWKMSLH